MHELSIMDSALTMALERAQAAGATRLHVLHLRIGALSGVVPEALEFAFESLAAGTPAEGGRLSITRVPAKYWCNACSREFESETMFAECPDCHQPSTDLRAGREMEVASMEIE